MLSDDAFVLTPLVVVCVPDIRTMVEPELSVYELNASESVARGRIGTLPLLFMPALVATDIGVVRNEEWSHTGGAG